MTSRSLFLLTTMSIAMTGTNPGNQLSFDIKTHFTSHH